MKTTYSYTCLRYVHDIATGEFANVGVLLYAPEARYAAAQCRTTYRRLTSMFPGMDGKPFRSLMTYIQTQFAALGSRMQDEAAHLPLKPVSQSVLDIAHQVLPPDDSSLQWGSPHGGVTHDPAAALSQVYARLVARYDEAQDDDRRNDEELWRAHRAPLESRSLLVRLQARTVTAEDDQYEFKRTWSNGLTTCIEPVSFDLASPSSFNAKAHRWLGLTTSLKAHLDRFHLIMLLGAPQDHSLRPDFDKATRILSKMPVRNTIVHEADADAFLTRIAPEIEKCTD